MKQIRMVILVLSLCIFIGCDKKDSDENAKQLAKDRATAEAEVQKQYDKQKAETEAEVQNKYAKEKAETEAEVQKKYAKEKAETEGQAQKEIENTNQAQKALAMEADLTGRHNFYSAMEGDYEGSIKIGTDTYKIKMIFARSIPPYTGSRVRQLSEIEVDINGLFLQAKIIQWHPADLASAVGCQINGSRPNMDLGNMTLSSNECPNFYQVSFSEDDVFDANSNAEKAKKLALKIKNGKLVLVPYLFGLIQPSNNAQKYNFIAKKIK